MSDKGRREAGSRTTERNAVRGPGARGGCSCVLNARRKKKTCSGGEASVPNLPSSTFLSVKHSHSPTKRKEHCCRWSPVHPQPFSFLLSNVSLSSRLRHCPTVRFTFLLRRKTGTYHSCLLGSPARCLAGKDVTWLMASGVLRRFKYRSRLAVAVVRTTWKSEVATRGVGGCRELWLKVKSPSQKPRRANTADARLPQDRAWQRRVLALGGSPFFCLPPRSPCARSAQHTMGIKGLTGLINDNAPGAIKQAEIKTLFGRKVAIDA